ncbi:hypothetical protein [Jeotgalibacillus sp. R-1-5s-1]|uniref:hypothetical protein n=1 Tax=Jeotgalibacillus sp. R-1-5s-1 TaxID=2555897 RepID=UPI00106B5C87|nr:hypothetical protein [Jeotgalibacillus sp. R-1-5s-1]TFD94453.1 hypothetical protein E2491_13540 [Jeotgalibacillus sp. R-1-5s-1]
MSIKHELDQSIPSSVRLTEDERRTILHRIHQQPSRNFNVKPLLAGAMTMLLLVILIPAFQSIQQASELSIQKITVPDVQDGKLINSIYLDNMNELVFSDGTGIVAYDVVNEEKKILTNMDHQSYDWVINDRWLAWTDLESQLHVLNRSTGKVFSMQEGDTYHSLAISHDYLIYMAPDSERKHMAYFRMDLNTHEAQEFHEMTGSSHSKVSIENEVIVIAEELKGHVNETRFTAHDINTLDLILLHEVPLDTAQEVQLNDGKIYAKLLDDKNRQVFGYVDMNTNSFVEIDTPPFESYAISGEYLLLTVWDAKRETDSAQLFKIEEKNAIATEELADLEERLIRPRLTVGGDFMFNGEGADGSVYVMGK